MNESDKLDKPDRNDTGQRYTYQIMWGWKQDIRVVEVEGDSHYEGKRGLKVTDDGSTVADFDRDAYRGFIRVPKGSDVPETRLEQTE